MQSAWHNTLHLFAPVDQTKTRAFKAWFGKSRVVDEIGRPLVVYRGEHGEYGGDFQSRFPSLSFGSCKAANAYSMFPNNRSLDEGAKASRVTPVYLRIENPLFLEPPPSLLPAIENPEGLKRLMRKFDPVERDFRNRKLGYAGEEFVFHAEIGKLVGQGNKDLAKRVRWVSQEDDSAGYDIMSFDPRGKEKLIEVKTTRGESLTPFYITQNELSVSKERADVFCIYRLYQFSTTAHMFELVPPIEDFVHLAPLSYRASFD